MQNFCNAKVELFNDLGSLLNKELIFGGVLTDVQHRVSRQGKGWASFTIEDYTGNFNFKIFGEEYLRFRHFLMLNNFLFVRVLVRDGWVNKETGKKGNARIQFNSFQLLHDVLESYAKRLSIQLNISDLDDQMISKIDDLLKNHNGNHNLSFVVYDNDESYKVDFKSRKKKIKISQDLLNELDREKVFYKLN